RPVGTAGLLDGVLGGLRPQTPPLPDLGVGVLAQREVPLKGKLRAHPLVAERHHAELPGPA
ncbi:MAG TPA: hypothetical protein VLG91_17185, partial [Streptomyces sp.]|nr:hypothetical protein [Streptomyces sp.]